MVILFGLEKLKILLKTFPFCLSPVILTYQRISERTLTVQPAWSAYIVAVGISVICLHMDGFT